MNMKWCVSSKTVGNMTICHVLKKKPQRKVWCENRNQVEIQTFIFILMVSNKLSPLVVFIANSFSFCVKVIYFFLYICTSFVFLRAPSLN